MSEEPETEMLARITRQVLEDLAFYNSRGRDVPPSVRDMALLIAEIGRLQRDIEITKNQNQKTKCQP